MLRRQNAQCRAAKATMAGVNGVLRVLTCAHLYDSYLGKCVREWSASGEVQVEDWCGEKRQIQLKTFLGILP